MVPKKEGFMGVPQKDEFALEISMANDALEAILNQMRSVEEDVANFENMTPKSKAWVIISDYERILNRMKEWAQDLK